MSARWVCGECGFRTEDVENLMAALVRVQPKGPKVTMDYLMPLCPKCCGVRSTVEVIDNEPVNLGPGDEEEARDADTEA